MNQNKKERNYTNYSPVSSEDNDDTPNRIVSSLNKNRESNQSTFDIDLKHVCIFALTMPILAFFTCIAISLFKDFEHSNQTHCRVRNILPSISSTISKFYPQIAIWRLLIGIDSFPRYFIAYIYFNKYYLPKKDIVRHPYAYQAIIRVAFLVHLIELTSLLLLSYVSSVEIFSVHKLSFIFFLTTSFIYMGLTLLTHFWPMHEIQSHSNRLSIYNEHKEATSKNIKIGVYIIYIVGMLMALYFYIRHNMFCEPYIYSLFSLFEYFIVFTNITYHAVIFYDLSLFQKGYKISFVDSICKANFD